MKCHRGRSLKTGKKPLRATKQHTILGVEMGYYVAWWTCERIVLSTLVGLNPNLHIFGFYFKRLILKRVINVIRKKIFSRFVSKNLSLLD